MRKITKILMFALFMLMAGLGYSQKVAVIGMNHTDPDGFAFVALQNLPSGEVIYFTENEYNNATDVFNTGEGLVVFTATSTIFKGDVVYVSETSTTSNIFTVSCTTGTCGTAVIVGAGDFALASGGDAIYAFSDNDNNPTNGVTAIHSVFFTGEVAQSGGNILAAMDPSGDHPTAIVIDGFPASAPIRTEYTASRTNTTKLMFENPSNYVHAAANAALSTSFFTNVLPSASNPALTIAATPATVSENSGTAMVYTVTLATAATSAVTVNFNVSGSAVFGTDYSQSGAASFGATTGTLVIASGATTASMSLTPIADAGVEPHESIVITLASGTGYDVGSPGTASTMINNDDTTNTEPFVALTGLAHADPDGFSFVAVKDIPANTTVYFTDNSFNNGTLLFGSGESVVRWVSPSTILAKGNVVVVTETGTNTNAYNVTCSGGTCGAITHISGDFAVASTGETMYAYSDNDTDPSNGVTDVYAVLFTGTSSVTGGNIPAVEDPSGVFLNALVVDGFASTPAPSRTEYNPSGRNVLVTDVNFENPSNWLFGQAAGVLSTTPFTNINVLDSVPPTAVCQSISVTPATGSNSVTITAAQINNGSTDNVGIATMSVTPNTFTCANVGTPVTVTLTVTDAAGNSSTCTATVTVLPNTTANFTQVPAICSGGSFTLPTTSTNGITGTWSPAINNTATTQYTFTPNSGQCASATATMTVVVNPNVTPTFTQVAAICTGGSFTLPTTSDNGVTGTWSPAISNTATTTYTFTPSAGQCTTGPVTMTVVVNQLTVPTFTQVAPICSGGSFTLPTTSNNNITGTWTPAISNTATTQYTFTPTAGQCADTATMTVTVNDQVTPTFTQVAAICPGGTYTLPATSNNNIAGTWSPAIDATQTTTYTFTPANGECATTATMTVVVNPTPATPVLTASTTCEGGTLTLGSNYAASPYSMNSNSNVAFIDIAATGASVGTLSDDSEHNITIPSFVFNGVTYTNARVGNNGAIVFGSISGDVAFDNFALPSTANNAGNVFLAPFWDDLLPLGGNTSIRTQTSGNLFIIQYTLSSHYVQSGPAVGTITFQVQLNTATGAIHYVYQDVNFDSPTYNNGVSATIGIQMNATTAMQYSFNTASVVDGQSISFTPSIPVTYAWTGPNNFVSTDASPTIPNATTAASGDYHLIVTNTATGCVSAQGTLNVTVTAPVTPAFAAISNLSCPTTSPLQTTSTNGITGTWSPAFVTTPGTTTVYTFTPAANQCATTTTVSITVDAAPGDPVVFGNNMWNVYAYASGDNSGTRWVTNYSGYYTIPTVSFSTLDQWCDSCSPSAAPNYVGCIVPNDDHSWAAKRQGFPAGNYNIGIPNHDDRAQLWVNGVMVWEHINCCDNHDSVWQGALGATDTVEFRVSEGGGGSQGIIAINLIEAGASLKFNESNNAVTLGQTLGNFGTGDFSIEMKVKTAMTGTYLLTKRGTCNVDNFINIHINNLGVVTAETYNNSVAANSVAGNTVITDDNWHHVALTRSSGVLRMYIDGVLDGTSATSPAVDLNNNYTLQLGGDTPCTQFGGNRMFNGNMDELRIWNRGLCQSEIQAKMNCEVQAAAGIGLLANYHFNQGLTYTDNTAVNTLTDSSGNNNNGALVNFTLTGSASNWSPLAGVVSGVACAPFALSTYYADADGDGYGNPALTVLGCQAPMGYVVLGTDCDDTRNNVHPGAVDVCGDGLDNDCNGNIDNVGQIGGCNPGQATLTGTYCGATLNNNAVTLNSNYVPAAQGYRFRVRNAATNVVIGTIDRPVNSFALSNMPGITLATTYLVDVALRVNNAWQPFYGQPCTVTTPTPVSTIGTQCGTTLTSMGQWVNATYQASVTAYRFRITNTMNSAVQVYEAPFGLNKFNFTQLPASFRMNGTTYAVEVGLRNTDGTWMAYGPSCNITTPGAPAVITKITVERNEFVVVAYPNPFAEDFMFDVKTSAEGAIQIRVYDMLGKQVENRNVAATEINGVQFGSAYPSGVYNVIVSQGENTQSIRIIKR